MSLEELKEEMLRLSPEARALLARELLASLEGMSEAEIEKLWVDEAIRRDEEIDKGTGRAFPAEEVLERARTRRK
ncbi:MAG: addiction module protein [Thermodesulfobacteriota bacterium]